MITVPRLMLLRLLLKWMCMDFMDPIDWSSIDVNLDQEKKHWLRNYCMDNPEEVLNIAAMVAAGIHKWGSLECAQDLEL